MLDLYSSVDVRACLKDSSSLNVLKCMVSFQLYHALKNTHRIVVYDALESGDFTALHETALTVARLFVQESGMKT